MSDQITLRISRLLFIVVCFALGSSLTADVDPTRFAKNIAEFEVDRIANPPPEGAVLCVGSSSMRMWSKRIKRDLHPLTVISRGFGGSQFSDVLYYFDELVVRYKPRAVLIYEGDNDVNSGKTPEQVFADFQEFRNKVKDFDSTIRIYVIGVKPSTTRWHLKEQIEETNQLIANACDADSNLVYIDVSKFLLNDAGEPRPDIFLEDGVHLNNIGYNLWAAAIGLKIVPAESPFESK